jgi:hypothetical protein
MSLLNTSAPRSTLSRAKRAEIEDKLDALVQKQREETAQKIEEREAEMQQDDTDHYLLFRVFGFDGRQAHTLDFHQNVSRILYRRMGDLMEGVSLTVLGETHEGEKRLVPRTEAAKNTSTKKETYEIDFLSQADGRAHEIKWRDSTTDGKHVAGEILKAKRFHSLGYLPVRVMYFTPQRDTSRSAMERINAAYHDLDGEVHVGEQAFAYMRHYTGFNVWQYINRVAQQELKYTLPAMLHLEQQARQRTLQSIREGGADPARHAFLLQEACLHGDAEGFARTFPALVNASLDRAAEALTRAEAYQIALLDRKHLARLACSSTAKHREAAEAASTLIERLADSSMPVDLAFADLPPAFAPAPARTSRGRGR